MHADAILILENLLNTAIHHQVHCKDEACNVSLFLIREAAKIIEKQVDDSEIEVAKQIIECFPKF